MAKQATLISIAQGRRRELRHLSRRLQDAEIEVTRRRAELDTRIYGYHQDGTSITDLALATGLSRETVYRAIERVRGDLAGGKTGR
jgi:CRP-like cAMP-binding protein